MIATCSYGKIPLLAPLWIVYYHNQNDWIMQYWHLPLFKYAVFTSLCISNAADVIWIVKKIKPLRVPQQSNCLSNRPLIFPDAWLMMMMILMIQKKTRTYFQTKAFALCRVSFPNDNTENKHKSYNKTFTYNHSFITSNK